MRPTVKLWGIGTLKQIPSYRNYYASRDGQVYRLGGERAPSLRPLKGGFHRTLHYRRVRVARTSKTFTNVVLHRLIAEAWLGPRPTGYHIHHKNGNRRDCSVKNLKYVSRRDHLAEHESGCWLTMRYWRFVAPALLLLSWHSRSPLGSFA